MVPASIHRVASDVRPDGRRPACHSIGAGD